MALKIDKFGAGVMTSKQKKAGKLLADPRFTGTVADLCKEIGVGRSTFYEWMQSEVFRSYVDGLIEVYTDAELSRAWKALMKLVDQHDIQAIKLFFELKGKYKNPSAESAAPVTVVINYDYDGAGERDGEG